MTTNPTTSLSKSPYTADPSLAPFLQPNFDPSTYLNSNLPSLSVSSTRPAANSVPLADLSAQTQTLLNTLNAQTTRLSNALTQLTDEIIRSGGRLAYEVEVLRGETTGLSDALDSGLKRDVDALAPKKKKAVATEETADGVQESAEDPEENGDEPEYLCNLRQLSHLRARLDAVIRVFGDATAWPLAPSETTSSFVSVSAPAETAEARDREAKARAFSEQVKTELQDLLSSATDRTGIETAAQRVEDLRVLAEVWRGTAEEKARKGFVEGLGEMVEDRRKALGRSVVGNGGTVQPRRGVDMRYGDLSGGTDGAGGGGFLSGLRRMGDGLYIE